MEDVQECRISVFLGVTIPCLEADFDEMQNRTNTFTSTPSASIVCCVVFCTFKKHGETCRNRALY